MWKRIGKSVLENATEGAAQGVGMAIGEELQGLVQKVDRIADKAEKMVSGDDLKRVENKIDEIGHMLDDVHNMVVTLYQRSKNEKESF